MRAPDLRSGGPPPRPRCHQARTVGAVKQRESPANRHNASRTAPATEALLDGDGRAALPRDRVHLTHGTCRGAIICRFHARDAHLVLSPGARELIPFRVLLDGEAPGSSHGVDVDEDGNGVLRDGRLYQLVRERARGPRADAGDHVPRVRRRGILVHVRVAGQGAQRA